MGFVRRGFSGVYCVSGEQEFLSLAMMFFFLCYGSMCARVTAARDHGLVLLTTKALSKEVCRLEYGTVCGRGCVGFVRRAFPVHILYLDQRLGRIFLSITRSVNKRPPKVTKAGQDKCVLFLLGRPS